MLAAEGRRGRTWSQNSTGRVGTGACVAALAVVVVLGGMVPSEAGARTYPVVACDAAPGGANNSWKARADRGMVAATACPTRGDADRGLIVRSGPPGGRVARGAAASMSFTAPGGTRLATIDYRLRGGRASREWAIGLVGDGGRLIAGCRAGSGSRRCRLAGAGPAHSAGLRGDRRVRLEVRCLAPGGCATGTRRRPAAQAALRSVTVSVEDRSLPRLDGTAGDLLTDDWQRGTRTVEVRASDPGGIRSAALVVDGVMRSSWSRDCDFTRLVPCGRSASRPFGLDTATLPDGAHSLTLRVADSAGNVGVRSRTIRVDNRAPLPVGDVRLIGGEGTRTANSFDLRWTPPPGQVSPLVATRYSLCRVGDPNACVPGVRVGGASGIDDVSVPGRGDWRFQAWLQDAAGNADPRNGSRPVVLSFDDRRPTAITAGVSNGRGGSAPSATVPYEGIPTIHGTLAGAGGAPLAGARVAVHSRVRDGSSSRHVATITTDGVGRFAYRPPRGPSRSFRFEYAGGERQRPATAGVRLAVRARSSFAVSRTRVRNGDRVRFSGRLLGGHVPPQGKLLELEAHYRGRWRPFAVTRTSPRGRWVHPYRFEGTRGRVAYRFRARISRDPDYPFTVGGSRAVRVVVDG